MVTPGKSPLLDGSMVVRRSGAHRRISVAALCERRL